MRENQYCGTRGSPEQNSLEHTITMVIGRAHSLFLQPWQLFYTVVKRLLKYFYKEDRKSCFIGATNCCDHFSSINHTLCFVHCAVCIVPKQNKKNAGRIIIGWSKTRLEFVICVASTIEELPKSISISIVHSVKCSIFLSHSITLNQLHSTFFVSTVIMFYKPIDFNEQFGSLQPCLILFAIMSAAV